MQSQFRLAFDVETQDVLVERVFDFFPRFADAGESAFPRIASGFEDAEKFAAGNDIEAGAGLGEQFQDGAIRVRFDRVANEVIERRERRIEPAIVIEDRARAIDIERRAELLRDALEIDLFAIKPAVAVMKRMHRESARISALACAPQQPAIGRSS